jgi:hypothetical protein
MSLKQALEKINAAVQDLSSLHVQTFTGKVDFSAAGSTYEDIKTAIDAAATDASITLVAESLYKFDGDSYNFLTNAEGGIPSSAMELHKAAVEGGIKTRQGLAELVKGVFD